jgi:hypothetical protein
VNAYFFEAYFARRVLLNSSATALQPLRDLAAVAPRDHYDAAVTLQLSLATDITPQLIRRRQQQQQQQQAQKSSPCRPADIDAAIRASPGRASVIFFHQRSAESGADNDPALLHLCACLGVWDLGQARGLYRGVLRLRWRGAPLLLVGSRSPFAATVWPPPLVFYQ